MRDRFGAADAPARPVIGQHRGGVGEEKDPHDSDRGGVGLPNYEEERGSDFENDSDNSDCCESEDSHSEDDENFKDDSDSENDSEDDSDSESGKSVWSLQIPQHFFFFEIMVKIQA